MPRMLIKQSCGSHRMGLGMLNLSNQAHPDADNWLNCVTC